VRAAPHGHVCWTFEESQTFQVRAREFLAAGVAAGERVWFVGSAPPAIPAELARSVEFKPVADAYGETAVIDAPAQVQAYRQATDEALAEGYTGLRVLADGTSLVRTAEQLEAFTRYEHLVDRYMLTAPFSAACAYDRRVLGGRAIDELACMHPASDAEVLFRLCACAPGQGSATLAGEIDDSDRDLFARALERAELEPVDGAFVLGAERLTFVDHRALLHLERYACGRDATVVLRTSLPSVARLIDLFGLTRVRVERAA
jgi:hypothetical protein